MQYHVFVYIETFARETFANFGHFRENLSRKFFHIVNSRKFISRNVFEFLIREFFYKNITILLFFS